MKKIIKLLIPLIILAGLVKFLRYPNNDQGYGPKQPIPYSHALHVGQNKMKCQYCHVGVEKSAAATVPSLNICMNCHNQVKTDSPLIKKLTAAYERGQSIQWVRIHDLPDHAKFVHKRHIAAGVNCQSCHGKIWEQEVVEKSEPLNMGTCLRCHREPHSTVVQEKNPYDNITPLTNAELKGPEDCGACHY